MDTSAVSVGQKLAWRLEYWGYAMVASLLRLLPIDAASDFGAWLVQALGPLTGIDKTVRRNLRLAFPDLTDSERDALRKAQWGNIGRYFAEFPLVDRLTVASGRIELIGGERLKALADQGRGAVLISGHLSNFETMASAIMSSGLDCVITFRPANNPYFNQAVIDSRRSYGVKVLAPKSADGTREMLAALARGQSVALLNDQKNNRGVCTPFFGHPANTATGPAKLALRSGGQVQPLSVQRLKGARFRVIAHEPLVFEQTGDRQADVEAAVGKITAFIEARVRERPAEWFWVHKRWTDEAYASLSN